VFPEKRSDSLLVFAVEKNVVDLIEPFLTDTQTVKYIVGARFPGGYNIAHTSAHSDSVQGLEFVKKTYPRLLGQKDQKGLLPIVCAALDSKPKALQWFFLQYPQSLTIRMAMGNLWHAFIYGLGSCKDMEDV